MMPYTRAGTYNARMVSRSGQTAHARATTGSIAALLCALVLYAATGLLNLRLPGLQYDEAADAVQAMETLQGRRPSSIDTFQAFGRDWPLMMLHHIGPTSIYTSLAGFALFGVSVEVLRATQLAVGGLAIVLTWQLGRTWFGEREAMIAAWLCATAPAFVWWSRAGANYTVPLLPIALGMMLAVTRWWRTGRAAPLAAAAFLLGAGITTKILFVWMLIPLGIVALLNARAARARLPGPAGMAAAALACAVGLGPMLIHNLPGMATLRFILDNAAQTRVYGHNNLDFARNFARVLEEFARMLGGDTLHFDAPGGLPIGPAAVAIAFAAALIGLVRNPAGRRHQPRLFLTATLAGVLPASTISTSSIGATYVFVIVPFTWLLVAVAIGDAATWLAQRAPRARRWLPAALTAALAASGLITQARIHAFVTETGGRRLWSAAIYPLADLLETRYAGSTPIAMDWGFRRSIELLTLGRVMPREVFDFAPAPSPRFADVSAVLLREPGNVYLFHTPDATAFGGHWDVFARQAQIARKSLALVEEITDLDGRPNTRVYVAGDAQPSFAVSSTLAGRNAVFATGQTLLGGSVAYLHGRGEVEVQLQWQRGPQAPPDDTVLVHIVEESSGRVVATGDAKPAYGNHPFPAWLPGEVVVDPRWVALPAGLSPGTYQVRIGLYDAASGGRRVIADPQNDSAGDSLMLARFAVPGAPR